MKFTQVPTDTFENLVLNAGILVDEFTPATGVIGNILGATTGGIEFSTNPTYTDFGEDIDNVPENTKQLKRLKSFDPAMSGTFLTVDTATVKSLIGAADIGTSDTTKVVPRNQLLDADFDDVWWVGDYSDKNVDVEGTHTAGYIAIHLMNALNTAGFKITSSKDNKAQMAFEYHGHYDISNISTPPFEIHVQPGPQDHHLAKIEHKNASPLRLRE